MNAIGEVAAGSPIFYGPEKILGGAGLPVLGGQTILVSLLAIVFAPFAVFAERTEKSNERFFVGNLSDKILKYVCHLFSLPPF